MENKFSIGQEVRVNNPEDYDRIFTVLSREKDSPYLYIIEEKETSKIYLSYESDLVSNESQKYVTSNDEYGYFGEGEPTDAQIELQDRIDNAIEEFVEQMRLIYSEGSGEDIEEFNHDIQKITEIRETVEEQYGLPDIY